jgi:hypothetical protein
MPCWSAVLPVVIPDLHSLRTQTRDGISARRKKYPAVALQELFNPPVQVIEPLIKKDISLLGKLVELICSEVFLATSPSNLLGLAAALGKLQCRFGISLDPGSERAKWADCVMNDIRFFSEHTSMTTDPASRRTILLVPAMTSRSTDYTVLGQASFLASGLTTVFCNASEPYGHGNSCIIGHDGWDRDDQQESQCYPRPGPYHGVLPGLFRPWSESRGRLEPAEQAMVIADIDPYYSIEGKPRPQMLPPPLELVAHLPILESRRRNSKTENDPPGRCGRSRSRRNDLIKALASIEAMFTDRELDHKTTDLRSTADDDRPSELKAKLMELGELVQENKRWLRRRAESYATEHAACPNRGRLLWRSIGSG